MMDITTSWTSTDQFPTTSIKGTARRACKVVGCNVDLEILNMPYCRKRRVCPLHMKADAVMCEGCGDQLLRFCQQCGKLESLSRFEGHKRSCRLALAKRRSREDDGRLNDTCLSRRCTKKVRQQQQAETLCKQPCKIVEYSTGVYAADSDMVSRVSCSEGLSGTCGLFCRDTAPVLAPLTTPHISTNSSQTGTEVSTALSALHCQESKPQQLGKTEAAQYQQQLRICGRLAQETLSSAVVDPCAASAFDAVTAATNTQYPMHPSTHSRFRTVADSAALESLLQAELESCLTTGKAQQAGMTDLDIERLLEMELLAVVQHTAAGGDMVKQPAAHSNLTPQPQQHPTVVATAMPALGQNSGAAMRSARMNLLQGQLMEVQLMLRRLQQLRSQQALSAQRY